MNFQERRQYIFDYLDKECFFPMFYEDNDEIIFLEWKGLVFYVVIDEQDELFYRIIFPSIDSVYKPFKKEVNTAISKTNYNIKMVKAYKHKDEVFLSAEFLLRA